MIRIYKNLVSSLLLGGTVLLGSSIPVLADPGDTTTVTSHTLQIMDWNENYDSVATFPDGSVSYRRILMEFVLGKYECEGYDPTNPGEGSGETGWCGDWDYDAHIVAMTAAGDTIELGELITPYANSTFPATYGWNWKHPYVFDVTDYYPILQGDVTIRIEYRGYSGGFTGTVNFHFIEGERAKDVVGITKLYRGSYPYGLASNPIEENVDELTLTVPTGADHAIFRTIISGHGGISGSNCSEFCKKWMKYVVNGSDVLTKDIWRDDCGSNWLAVQSGTWVYDRANWCPGNAIDPWIVNIPSSAIGGSTFTADIDFQPFTASGEGASYKMSTYAIYYGGYNHDLDAGIEDIIIPNSFVEKKKVNPACGDAKLVVKNYGAQTITSIVIGLQIGTGEVIEKTFDVDLASDQSAELLVEDYEELFGLSGTHTFKASIISVNGATDDEPYNNNLSSTFVGASVHTADYYTIQLKTNSRTNGVNTMKWELFNVTTGELVYTRVGNSANTIHNDTFRLYNNCYKLVTTTPEGLGLAFFGAYSGKGYVRLFNTATNTRIPMPGNDMDNTGLEGNFGNGFTYYFTVNSPNSIDDVEEKFFTNIYPNPASNLLNIELNTIKLQDASIQIINNLGQTILNQEIDNVKSQIDISKIASGMYSILIKNNGATKVEKISIVK